jgi:non-canonical purine NTP pyrophosphatase (RdgB/HAM1 family)
VYYHLRGWKEFKIGSVNIALEYFVARKGLTFITSNTAKAEQLSRYLDYPVLHHKVDLVEIQSLSLEEVVEYKAREAYKQVGTTVLVEDTALVFSALGNLPGPFIKWFLGELGNEGLCRLLDKYTDRSALAMVCFGLYNGNCCELFEGEMLGSIAAKPRGENSFGWESIFIPQGYQKTWGEMSSEEQQACSMRRIALKKLETYLKE